MLIERLITENISRLSSYLSLRYDVAKILGARGELRHPALLKCLKNMVTYDLYARQGRGHVGEVIQKQYHAAIDWLEQVAAGHLDPALPLRPDAQGHMMGGNKAYSTRF